MPPRAMPMPRRPGCSSNETNPIPAELLPNQPPVGWGRARTSLMQPPRSPPRPGPCRSPGSSRTPCEGLPAQRRAAAPRFWPGRRWGSLQHLIPRRARGARASSPGRDRRSWRYASDCCGSLATAGIEAAAFSGG
jgi:hypothetical protein